MSKLRVRTRFATTPVNLLNNKEMSLKAKGLYGYLQSKPDDWDFSLKGIVGQLKEGFDAIREAVKELEMAGYLARTNYQNEKGQWDCDYELFAEPQTPQILSKNKPQEEKPYRENPYTDNSDTGKPLYISKIERSKIEEVKDIKIKKEQKFNAETFLRNLDLEKQIKDLLFNWLEIRKIKRVATTQKAIELVLEKLNVNSLEVQKQMVENSIMNSWTGIFEIKQPQFTINPNNQKQNLEPEPEKDFDARETIFTTLNFNENQKQLPDNRKLVELITEQLRTETEIKTYLDYVLSKKGNSKDFLEAKTRPYKHSFWINDYLSSQAVKSSPQSKFRHNLDMSQRTGESLKDFEFRCGVREAMGDVKIRKHYLPYQSSPPDPALIRAKFEIAKQAMVRAKQANYN